MKSQKVLQVFVYLLNTIFFLPFSYSDGKYKALVIEFSLSSASYATMVLREVLKCHTSSSSQSKLNNYDATIEKTDIEEKTEAEEVINDKIGLLNDVKKYEAFKNIVFNNEQDTCLKRKAEECLDDSEAKNKVLKTGHDCPTQKE